MSVPFSVLKTSDENLFYLYVFAGFQRAGHPPRGHHRPHRLLLAGQLHPGGNFNHVSARRFGLPDGGMRADYDPLQGACRGTSR